MRWEYKTIEVTTPEVKVATFKLNGWGREGWELVSAVYDYQRDKHILYLKREVK